MPFYDVSKREVMEIVRGGTIRTFWGDKSLLAVVELDAHTEVPAHTHPNEQGGILLEGEMEMGIGIDTKLLKPGDIYIIPGNVQHWARTKNGTAKALDVFSPVREDYKY